MGILPLIMPYLRPLLIEFHSMSGNTCFNFVAIKSQFLYQKDKEDLIRHFQFFSKDKSKTEESHPNILHISKLTLKSYFPLYMLSCQAFQQK